MARAGEIERTVQQSVLDRLMDDEPRLAGDPSMTWSDSVRALKQTLRRDLEWLLNTRRTPQPAPEACEEVRQSLYRYGLPDVTSLHRDAPDTPARLALEVEEAIALFEPRLAGARVSLVEDDAGGERRIHFVIEAMLRMDPTPERVVFDTVLDVAKNEFEVQQAGAAPQS
ncbi:MAG TPA: type VI secretion system baseplate subunit TssE [Gemmatimonadaceae bacterium]|nr:type VI secretion system baseplate subunit TssE [Gemmatimonadaceae bacterium]